MLARVKSARRGSAVVVVVFAVCFLAGLALSSVTDDMEPGDAVDAFWRCLLAEDVVAVAARLTSKADVDAGSLVKKYSGYRYEGVVERPITLEGDIAVVLVQIVSPNGYKVTVLTVVQKDGRDWKVRSTSTSR